MQDFDRDTLEMLAQLLPSVASSLRSPLDSLHLAAQGLIAKTGDNSPEAAILRQSCFRMLRLVNNMSMAAVLSNDQPFVRTNGDLVSLAEELYRHCSALCQLSGVRLTLECQEKLLSTAIERDYLQRAMWNLLSNALKFTPAGGEITLRVEKAEKMALLSVSDTGSGISAELMASVFDRCLHEEEQTGQPHGLGLGLLIARRVAELHGGRLLLESREGEGTTVTMALPLEQSPLQRVNQPLFDYAGGFSPALLELSDALPYRAFFSGEDL